MENTDRKFRIAGDRRDLVAGLVIIVMLAAIVFNTYQNNVNRYRYEQMVSCQAKVNDQLRIAISARDPSFTQQLRAQLELAELPVESSLAERQAALDKFTAQLRAAIEKRRGNPLPTMNCTAQ